jgi:hypothetical protein
LVQNLLDAFLAMHGIPTSPLTAEIRFDFRNLKTETSGRRSPLREEPNYLYASPQRSTALRVSTCNKLDAMLGQGLSVVHLVDHIRPCRHDMSQQKCRALQSR